MSPISSIARLVLVVPMVLICLRTPAEAADEVVGKTASPAGTLLRRDGKGKWHALKPKSDVHAGDLLLALPGSRGEVEARGGAVQLSIWANVPEFYNFPVLESEIELHANAERVLDFTLVRGRVLLAKRKGKEASLVRLRFNDKAYDLSLAEVGTEISIERYGRWPRGSRFNKRPKPDEVPVAAVAVFVSKGRADLKLGAEQYLMNAPSAFHWNNILGQDRLPQKVQKLPDWVEEAPHGPEAKPMLAAVQRVQKQLADKTIETILVEDLRADDASIRKLAVYSVGALNDLPHLVDSLDASKHADVRETAISALRHWIGAGPGQDLRLYRFLVDQRMHDTNQAEIILQLLHSFEDGARERAETYETMIEYLRHENMAIRELARWHLYRWVIAGRDIPYNAAGTRADLERAYKAWKKLIPDGKLPPRPAEKK